MTTWLIAIVAGLAFSFLQYGRRVAATGRAPTMLAAAAARTGAVALLVALLLDAAIGRSPPVRPWVALDVSESMVRGDSALWRAALDTVAALPAESTFAFGDSVRLLAPDPRPGDRLSIVRHLADRSLAAGKPLVVVTDGELEDPAAAAALPPGSRIVVLAREPNPDLAVLRIDVPRSVVVGDSVRVSVAVRGGPAPSGAASVKLELDGTTLTDQQIGSLGPGEERVVHFDVPIPGPQSASVMRAVLQSPNDPDPRNDTLSAALQRVEAAEAVFVTTSPDLDSRAAIDVLRGALSISTRAYVRVAPGTWRLDGPLTPVTEAEVRRAIQGAPVAIIHGDTAIFGPPRSTTVTLGSLGLLVPAPSMSGEEWYVTDSPLSPLSSALAGTQWEGLAPIAVGYAPTGDWVGLNARRGRGAVPQPFIAGIERPRRVVIVAASGLWRWSSPGPVAGRPGGGSGLSTSVDVHQALWGSIFDWLAAERSDVRAALPDAGQFRAGSPIRWRRGSSSDSLVIVEIRRRGATTPGDSIALAFGDATTVESAPLDPGVYDVFAPGGTSLLVVNRSAEWNPRAVMGTVSGRQSVDGRGVGTRLRLQGWVYVAIIALLCGEWLLRRRVGLR